MRIFIPDTKTILTLTKPWTFTLYEEYRNFGLFDSLGLPYDTKWYLHNLNNMPSHSVTLPTGTKLGVDRVYIRRGTVDSYDSLTFRIKSCPDKKIKGRFWAKLFDVNKIYCEMSNVTPTVEFKVGEKL